MSSEHTSVRVAKDADLPYLAGIQWRAIRVGVNHGYLPIQELGAGRQVKPLFNHRVRWNNHWWWSDVVQDRQ